MDKQLLSVDQLGSEQILTLKLNYNCLHGCPSQLVLG